MRYLKNFLLSLDKGVTIRQNSEGNSFYFHFPNGGKIRVSDHLGDVNTADISVVRSMNNNTYVVNMRGCRTLLSLSTKEVKNMVAAWYWMRMSFKAAKTHKDKMKTQNQSLQPDELSQKKRAFNTKFWSMMDNVPQTQKHMDAGQLFHIYHCHFNDDEEAFRGFVDSIPEGYNVRMPMSRRVISYFQSTTAKNKTRR